MKSLELAQRASLRCVHILSPDKSCLQKQTKYCKNVCWHLQSSKEGKAATLRFLNFTSLCFHDSIIKILFEATRRTTDGKYKCIKQFYWGLIIAEFVTANMWNSVPLTSRWLVDIHHTPLRHEANKKFCISFINFSVKRRPLRNRLIAIINHFTKSGSHSPAVDWSLESLVQMISVIITARSSLWEPQPSQQGFPVQMKFHYSRK